MFISARKWVPEIADMPGPLEAVPNKSTRSSFSPSSRRLGFPFSSNDFRLLLCHQDVQRAWDTGKDMCLMDFISVSPNSLSLK